jgi:RecA-family ATPase
VTTAARAIPDASVTLLQAASSPRKGPACRIVTLETSEELLADQSLWGDAGWVVEGLLIKGINVPYGSPKVGKGTWLLHVVRQILAGEPCYGRAVTAGPVLWIDMEQGRRLMRRKVFEAGASDLDHPLHVYSGPPLTMAELEGAIAQTSPVLVVIDSLARFLCLENENDNAEMTARIGPLVELAQRVDIAIAAIHHERKSGGEHGAGMRGGSALFGLVDVAIHVKREPGDDSEHLRRLELVSRYDEANGKKLIVQRNADFTFSLLGSPIERRKTHTLEAITADPQTVQEIADRLNVKRQAIEGDVRLLYAEGTITRSGTGKKNDPYRFAVASTEGME